MLPLAGSLWFACSSLPVPYLIPWVLSEIILAAVSPPRVGASWWTNRSIIKVVLGIRKTWIKGGLMGLLGRTKDDKREGESENFFRLKCIPRGNLYQLFQCLWVLQFLPFQRNTSPSLECGQQALQWLRLAELLITCVTVW